MSRLIKRVRNIVLCALLVAWPSYRAAARPAPSAPNFALHNLDGEVVQLSSFRGHTVVLDFWASWCPPCIAQIPSLRRLTKKYKSQGVIVLDINVLDEQNVVEKFIAEHGEFGSDVLLTLEDESVVSAFGVEQFPSTIIVDRRGRIVATFSGGAPEDAAKIEAAVRSLMSRTSPRAKQNHR